MINTGLLILHRRNGCGNGNGCSLLPFTGGRIAQNDGIEGAVLAVHGYHTVGLGRIVVNGVAGVQDLRMVADLDLQVTTDHDVALLALVGDQLNGLIFRAGTVLGLHIKRQRDTVAEVCRQVEAQHIVGLFDPLAFSLTGQGIGTQLGAAAFQQVAHIHAEDQYATV